MAIWVGSSDDMIINDEFIELNTNASVVDATSMLQDVVLHLDAPFVTVIASALTPVDGAVTLLGTGDIEVGAAGIRAGNLALFNTDGDITGVGTVTAPTVVVKRGDSAQLLLSDATLLDIIVDGDITLSNTGASATDMLLVSLFEGDISLNNGNGDIRVDKAFAEDGNIGRSTTGSITATTDPSTTMIGLGGEGGETFTPPGNTITAYDPSMTNSGGRVTLNVDSIDASIQTTTTGDTRLVSSSNADLMVVDSSSSDGDYSLTHQGNVDFDLIQAQNVTIDTGTTGNITDVSGNTLIASGITLTGNNIFVSTQGQIITLTAAGEVTVSNTVVDVTSLTVDANGNVIFGTEGDLTITQVAGGPLVSLQAGNNIDANTGAVVSGTDVKLEAGGQITPDVDNPLNV